MERMTARVLVMVLSTIFALTEPPSTAAEESADIWKAAAGGDVKAIRQHLDAGVDIDAKEQPGGGTPLLVAAVFGRVEAAKLLIEKGANVSAKSNDGTTALHGAAFFCHTEVAKLLLAKGAEVNAKSKYPPAEPEALVSEPLKAVIVSRLKAAARAQNRSC